MGKNRLELQHKLEEILENKNVYYQPPENLKMKYPAIRYRKNDRKHNFADNVKYKKYDSYELTILSYGPDNPAINKILNWPYTSYDRNYVYDNIYHDVITLYYKEDK